MKVAVTGADGNVGRQVVQELLRHGYEVRTVTMAPWEQARTENAVANIVNYDEMVRAFEGCDAVIHLAAIPSPRKDLDSEVFHNNVMGVYNAALGAGLNGVKRMAIASSDCALGFTFRHASTEPVYFPLDEHHPATPDNGYGMSKLAGEQAAAGIAKRFGMSIASLRISYVAKPEFYESELFMRAYRDPANDPINNMWSYIDIRDCARAFRLAIEADLGGHEVFHVTAANTRCGVPTQEMIARFFPDAEVRSSFSAYESLHDISKAARLLKFTPEFAWNRVD